MRIDEIAELEKGKAFVWGRMLHLYDIGDYNIVEYNPWKVRNCHVLTGFPDLKKRRFHTYIKGVSTSHSYPSMDEALVGVIAYKLGGCNTRADRYFFYGVKGE